MAAQIKYHNGTPTLFFDGKPCFDGLMWGSAPEPDQYSLKNCARYYGEAGVHLFTFDVGTGGSPANWVGPKPGKKGDYDFSKFGDQLKQLLDADPQALFHLRVHLEMPEWWQKLHPEECELTSEGNRLCQSYASKLWRKQAKDFLRAFTDHVESIGASNQVFAYQTGAGGTGEWVKATAGKWYCGDFSQPMKEHFREWLMNYYQGDVKLFRDAWADPYITFDKAEVPPAAVQIQTTHLTFRDPKKEQRVIDYYRCLAELCGDLVVDYCTTVKEATNGKALAGAFYGYLMELAWNSDFFADEAVAPEVSMYQRSGHLGLWKALQSPNVDFLVSPYSYGFRGIGGEGPSMLPAESARLHGKLYIFEEDTRTHISWHDNPNYGKTDVLDDSIAVLRRNLSYVVCHGQGIWWLGGGGPQSPHIELSQQPAFRPMIKRFQEIGQWSQQLDRKPCAEIAVLIDDESFFYETIKNDLDMPLIFEQRLWGLPKVGAPFDTYLLQDLVDGNMPPYKLYIFLNPLRLNQERRIKLTKQIQQDHRVALWIYAPGYIKDSPSLVNMSELTGFQFGKGDHPWGPLMHITNFDHPITQDLSPDLFWGTNNRLGPVFHLDDPGAVYLGNVVYSQGRCRPGMGVKVFPDWTSIYVAAPNIPAPVLRGIARFSGVHIYNSKGDTLYATKQLLGVHTAGGGERVFKLPKKVEVIQELFSGMIIAENTDEFSVKLSPASTELYYTGDAKYLASFGED